MCRQYGIRKRSPLTGVTPPFVPIFKKGSRSECGNHRGVSLISVASKLLASIILHRLTPTRNELLREEQAGFRPGRGCIDHIFTLRQVLEHRYTFSQSTVVVFLDIKGAFDSVDRSTLVGLLSQTRDTDKYVKLLQAIYAQTSGRMRAYGELSPPFDITSGVRQGCPLSPFLFTFVMDDCFQRTLVDSNGGGVELLPGAKLCDLEYADDAGLLSDDPQVLQHILDRLEYTVSSYGMTFAPHKCKILLQDWQGVVPVLTLGGERLEIVERFMYLGSYIGPAGLGDEISQRIAKARVAFGNLRHLWHRRDISLSLKGRVYNASIRSVLLYACETWSVRSDDVQRLPVFDHRCLRSIAGVWWEHRISNELVRQRIFGTGPLSQPISSFISHHRLRWLGHVLRMPSHRLPHRALWARPGTSWKRRSRGQRMTWVRGMRMLTLPLGKVGRSRLPGWGPKDEVQTWLNTLSDMAMSRIQWRTCCKAPELSPHTYITQHSFSHILLPLICSHFNRFIIVLWHFRPCTIIVPGFIEC